MKPRFSLYMSLPFILVNAQFLASPTDFMPPKVVCLSVASSYYQLVARSLRLARREGGSFLLALRERSLTSDARPLHIYANKTSNSIALRALRTK